jgi:hypothetical protein
VEKESPSLLSVRLLRRVIWEQEETVLRWRSEYATVVALVLVILITIYVMLNPGLRDWVASNITSESPLPDWIAVAVLGALVGTGELVARYKDAPFRALLTPPAFLYVAINIAAALGALFLIRAFGWEFGIGGQQGQSSSDITVRITQVMVAGLGAMALLRSSLFITRIENQDVGVGPSTFLSTMLNACDAGVDRERAVVRAHRVNRAMTNISYTKASVSLVAVSAKLMQNLSPENITKLQDEALDIDKLPITERAKGLSLGLHIMNYVGAGPLEGAIEALGEAIKGKSPRIKILRPTEGAEYQINQVVQAAYFCETDSLEKDVRLHEGTVPDGEPIDTSTVGTKTFTVTAEDKDGNKNTESRTYAVVDTNKPQLILPNNITAKATDAEGAKVTFDVEAIADDPPNPPVTCTHASGSIFPMGETTVLCSATDHAGNEAKGSFKVIVEDE